MAPADIGKALQGVSGALGAIGGLFAAVVALNDQIRQGWEVLNALPAWGWAAVAIVLLLTGIWQLSIWRQKRSELMHPEALRLERNNPAHLVGREDDIAALEQKCRGNGLVFLEGESGSGKSALVQAGLLPRVRAGGQMLPLVVSIWGTDWERGPQRELADELWTRLDADQREKLKLSGPPEADALAHTLSVMRSIIGVTPLLVFDQFDDYQARHREKFLPRQRKSWLSARRLNEANALWHTVAGLCDQQAVHILVITRSDTAAGLESVRFQEPETHRLDRLHTAFVAPLLAQLVGTGNAAAIRAPERGWEGLRHRLAHDLEQDGFVLPQQLRSALAGLRSLRYLTVADYEMAGGLAGLEARVVELEVKSAARTSGLTEAAVRQLLLAMVEGGAGGKTVARALNELTAAAGDPKLDEHAVRSALDKLRSDAAELVRQRIDPDTQSEAWLLDHDYLTRGIVAAERNANRWRAMLEEGARALAEAGTFIRRWRALLKPSKQVVLLWARARGLFMYGPYRAYAGKSVARLGPYIALVALMIGVGVAAAEWQARERAADEANAILQHLLFAGPELTHNEIDALWWLASTDDERVRDSFARQLLASATFAERFNRNPDPVARALAGLNITRAPGLGHESIGGSADADLLPQQVAAVNLGLLLGRNSAEFTEAQKQAVLTARRGSNFRVIDPTPLTMPTEAQVQAVLTPVLTTMESTTDPYVIAALAETVQALEAGLSDGQAQKTFVPVLTAMQRTTDPGARWLLAQALQALGARLTHAQAHAALEAVLIAMRGATDSFALRTFAQTVQVFAARATDAQVQAVLTPVLTTMESTTDPYVIAALAETVQAFGAKLTDGETQETFAAVLTVMKGTENPSVVAALAETVQALGAKLTDSQTQAALDPVLTVMQRTTDPGTLRPLAQALQALAPRLGARDGPALAAVRFGLAQSATEDTAKSFLEAADAVTANDNFDEFVILAFDLLKYPTVTGKAEAYVLQRLRERSGGEAPEVVDLWSAVGWAERRGIDVASPPQRPTLQITTRWVS